MVIKSTKKIPLIGFSEQYTDLTISKVKLSLTFKFPCHLFLQFNSACMKESMTLMKLYGPQLQIMTQINIRHTLTGKQHT